MPDDRPEPPKANENARLIAERLRVVQSRGGTRETVTIEWRGRDTAIDVIDMPVDSLYYNPETHRIAAQVSLDPARCAELKNSPWSEGSQAYLHELLCGDPGDPRKRDPRFDELRADLKANGQKDPGIVTSTGVLVNGNTRRAALKENGAEIIRVGVLADDWSWSDVNAIELSLQLRKDLKREYSFINYLLAVDEQVRKPNADLAEVARNFRQKPVSIDQAQWILLFIRDAIRRSRVTKGDSVTELRLIDFEGHQGKLEELWRAYRTEQKNDPAAADRLREGRLIAMLLDKAKTDSRLIDGAFFDEHLSSKLPKDLLSYPGLAGANETIQIPGLAAAVRGAAPALSALKSLTDRVLRARALRLAAPDTEADELLGTVADAMEKSLDAAGRTTRLKQAKLAAPERLQAAAEEVAACAQRVHEARVSNTLDTEALDDAASALRAAVRKLAEQVARSVPRDGCGPGILWLLAAPTIEE